MSQSNSNEDAGPTLRKETRQIGLSQKGLSIHPTLLKEFKVPAPKKVSSANEQEEDPQRYIRKEA
jgi:hypothetical protein